MVRRILPLAAIAACAFSVATAPAFAGPGIFQFSNADFAAAAAAGDSTPVTVDGVGYASPSDPGAFSFGANAGLYTELGPYTLTSLFSPDALTITFPTAETSVAFGFAVSDFFASLGSGPDTITITPSAGVAQTVTANLLGSDLFPEGYTTFTSTTPFNSITLTSAYGFTIAPVPEPVSMTLFGVGLAGLLAARRRRA